MKADLIIKNASVISVNKKFDIYEAVAIKGNKILAVGTNEELEKLSSEKTRVINAEGRSVIPGIIDAHVHTTNMGLNAMSIDCRSPQADSIEIIKDMIRDATKKTPKGEWIRGWGYDHTKLKERRHPNKWDLDEVAPDHPVVLTRVCSHISAHNSKSLEKLKINNDTVPPAGGEFERLDGEISGVLFENAHMDSMKVSAPSRKELVDAVKIAGDILIKQGITSVHDSGGFGARQMEALKHSPVRTYAMIFSFIDNLEFVQEYLDSDIYTGWGDDHFRIGPIKLMIDGSSSGPTAATLEPYENTTDNHGIMSMEQDAIDAIVMRANANNWQITCHAVGDKAVSAIVSSYEKALHKCPRNNHRHRIEHAAMINENLLKRIKRLNIIPIPQPVFIYDFGDGYIKHYGTRGENMFPCATFVDNGIIAAGSSDCPITYSNPFLNIHTAVNRETQSGSVLNSHERISKENALRLFTYNSAYAEFAEDKKGSIEPGKLADLVILSRDYLCTPDSEIKAIKAVVTIIDGEVVYDNLKCYTGL